MSQWLQMCRASVEQLKVIFAEYSTTADRAVETGQGAGGDETLIIDKLAEDAIFAELEKLHRAGKSFTAISEERGEVVFGEGAEAVVVIDPIDGSLNAKRTIPFFTVSIAVTDGPTMADVLLGYVYDFGADEEFYARRGAGAFLDDVAIDPGNPGRGLEVVGVESAAPVHLGSVARSLDGKVFRLRCFGSIAITLAYLAVSRVDGMLTVRPCRSVDSAAGQLIAREAGAQVAFLDADQPLGAGLRLDQRSRCIAARSQEGLEVLRGALST